MTKDEILSMALEFGWKSYSGPVNVVYSFNEKDIERFAALVAEKEREECARAAAEYGPNRPIVTNNPSSQTIGRWEGEQAASAGIAIAIRARGNK